MGSCNIDPFELSKIGKIGDYVRDELISRKRILKRKFRQDNYRNGEIFSAKMEFLRMSVHELIDAIIIDKEIIIIATSERILIILMR